MKSTLRIALRPGPAQVERLSRLQARFAEACNGLAPLVQQTRCWNRVALHHMAYRGLRERFPDLGSQMVCNAIYSVCRASRLVYQHPKSPFNVDRLGANARLPRLAFAPNSPVFFDRHTLSIKDGHASMFTLDGRMRFELALRPEAETRFREEKLKEVVMSSEGGCFFLLFHFGGQAEAAVAPTASAARERAASGKVLPLPSHLAVLPASAA